MNVLFDDETVWSGTVEEIDYVKKRPQMAWEGTSIKPEGLWVYWKGQKPEKAFGQIIETRAGQAMVDWKRATVPGIFQHNENMLMRMTDEQCEAMGVS